MGRLESPEIGAGRGSAQLLAWSDLAAMALLVVVALWLRTPGLSTLGLYRDDAWPALATKASLSDALGMGVTTPGFELFLRSWLSVSQATPWAQAPALAAAILSIVGVYLLARRVGCERVAAMAAGGLLALAPINVLFATRVKPYQFDALSTVALIAAAVGVAEQPSSRRRWAVLMLVSVASAVFSASTLAVSISAVAWCAVLSVRRGRGRSRLLGTVLPVTYLALVGAYATLVLGRVPPSLRTSWSGHYISASTPAELVRTTTSVVGSFAAGVFPTNGVVAALVLVVLALGALWYRPPLAVLVMAPVLVALGLALVHRAPFGGGRIDIYLYPCVALLAAMAIQKILDTGPAVPTGLAQLALAAAIVVYAATNGLEHVRANPYPAADIGPLTAAVRARMEPGDAMVVGPFSRYPFALYGDSDPQVVMSSLYAPGFTVRSRDPDVLIMPAEFFEDGYDEDQAVRFAEGRARVWYLATDTPESDTPGDVQAYEYRPEQRLLADGFEIVERIEGVGVHADLLVRSPAGPETGQDPPPTAVVASDASVRR